MSTRKRFIADLLFGSQLVIGVLFASSRILRVHKTLNGVLLSEFILVQAFALLGLWLAIAANRAQRSRIAIQSVAIYVFWSVALAACIASTLTSRSGAYRWSGTDTTALVVGALGAILVISIGRAQSLTVRDPMVRGWIALVLKGWPQLALGFKIFQESGAGLPLLALTLGHVTILIRLMQLAMAIKEAGWDRNRRGLFLSELGNELTWCVTTAAWILF